MLLCPTIVACVSHVRVWCLSILRGFPTLLCVGEVFRLAAGLRLCVWRVVYARIPICARYLPCSPPGFHLWFLCCPSLAVLRVFVRAVLEYTTLLCSPLYVLSTILLSFPLAALLVLLVGTPYSFWSVADDSSGYMRFASAHVIHRPPFECLRLPTILYLLLLVGGRICMAVRVPTI